MQNLTFLATIILIGMTACAPAQAIPTRIATAVQIDTPVLTDTPAPTLKP